MRVRVRDSRCIGTCGLVCLVVIGVRWGRGERANARTYRHGTDCAGGHLDPRCYCLGRDFVEEVDILLGASCEF